MVKPSLTARQTVVSLAVWLVCQATWALSTLPTLSASAYRSLWGVCIFMCLLVLLISTAPNLAAAYSIKPRLFFDGIWTPVLTTVLSGKLPNSNHPFPHHWSEDNKGP